MMTPNRSLYGQPDLLCTPFFISLTISPSTATHDFNGADNPMHYRADVCMSVTR